MSLCTTVYYALWQCGSVVNLLLRGNNRRWDAWIFRKWSKGMARIFGMRIAVRGQPPRAPFLLVTNHLSYVDILLLASQLGCTFISRHDIKSWPIIGHLTTRMGTIYINRGLRKDVVRVGNMINAALQRGEGIVLFAEGTSTAGAQIDPLKPSLLEFAAQSRQPVHYASLNYRTDTGERPAHLAVCWWGDMDFSTHVFKLLKLRRFYAEIVFGEGTVSEADRKSLALKLHERLSRLFTPIVKSEDLS
jgi:1-acyl-sn-glycerol-3-phosphate acyltransferase